MKTGSTEARTRAQAKYDAEHTTGVYLKFNTKNDADILDMLASVSNKQGYIKELIRADIKRRGY